MECLAPPYIGIKMTKSGFLKISNTLPYPTYQNSLIGAFSKDSVMVVYKIDGVMKSDKQWRWINSIRAYLNEKLTMPFEWVDEFYIHEQTEASGCVYSLQELSEAFGEKELVYPDLFFTSDQKTLYRRLAMYASKLNYLGIMYTEGVFAGAMLLNKHLLDVQRYNERELWGKAKAIVSHIHNHPEKYKQKLSAKQLKGALSRGGVLRASQKLTQADENRKKVFELVSLPRFQKSNGKPKVSLIADTLGLHRTTVHSFLSQPNTPIRQ